VAVRVSRRIERTCEEVQKLTGSLSSLSQN